MKYAKTSQKKGISGRPRTPARLGCGVGLGEVTSGELDSEGLGHGAASDALILRDLVRVEVRSPGDGRGGFVGWGGRARNGARGRKQLRQRWACAADGSGRSPFPAPAPREQKVDALGSSGRGLSSAMVGCCLHQLPQQLFVLPLRHPLLAEAGEGARDVVDVDQFEPAIAESQQGLPVDGHAGVADVVEDRVDAHDRAICTPNAPATSLSPSHASKLWAKPISWSLQ